MNNLHYGTGMKASITHIILNRILGLSQF